MVDGRGILTTLIFTSLLLPISAFGLLIEGPDIINAPESVIDDAPGVRNENQQGFNEMQDVLLLMDLVVDQGVVEEGTVVDSHMIFLNSRGHDRIKDLQATWKFDGEILGVMSDRRGRLEVASSDILGAAGTIYPDRPFGARGLEHKDMYQIIGGSSLLVDMTVSEPGDWIRVVTRASTEIPEPATLTLFGMGLLGGAMRRKKVKAS